MHYADFCSQTQTEFLTMGCSDRRFSSQQCISRALDYASSCACDRRNCADHVTIMEYSFIGTTVSMLVYTMITTLGYKLMKLIDMKTKKTLERDEK